ncbi:Transposable element Tc3 transposase [Folsomia candida]|uniref:Transposable element Tc3 transposase n=1 Tax=Folsomia candida TaxID=158441 RepID=A0A226EBC9_FOLCA|nr:Transposable element Tc3 transposase [Folsomia candida]
MPTGKPLSDYQLGQIDLLHEQGASQSRISQFLGCSQSAISNYLNSKTHQGLETTSYGRPKILTPRDERQISKLAATGQYSIREIQRELPFTVSKDTVHRSLTNNTDLEWRKKLTQPPLTQRHKGARLEFARKHMSWDKEWQKVIFTDEKKFNLDGPDGYSYYWHHLKKEPEIFSKRQAGGGSVMLWGGFGYNGKTELASIPPRTDSLGYQEVLKANLIREGPKIGGRGWIFQQDNASIHASRSTMDFLARKNVRTLPWLARSPDLNPMENLWAELSRGVYSHGRQYRTKQELERQIHEEWANIPLETLQNLNDSMKRRIFELILIQGGFTKY